jgi:hypothetical protein
MGLVSLDASLGDSIIFPLSVAKIFIFPAAGFEIQMRSLLVTVF